MQNATRDRMALALVVASTLLGLMGTDLVLPAVPSLPETLGGEPADAQMVLAAYVGGTCVGLLGFGALGDRFSTRSLFIASLLLTALTSLACAAATTIGGLIGFRALQGAVAAGPAVFAPAIVRAMFDEVRAVRAIGALGSIEALAPALAPILGAWLLILGGWTLSFLMMGAIALAVAVANIVLPLVPETSRRPQGSYARLLGDPVYLRYALSQAFVLGGLLVFVFGAPAMFVHALGGSLSDFILMQMIGIAIFAVAANMTGSIVTRFGPEPVIVAGTVMAMLSAGAIATYAVVGGTSILVITGLFLFMNAGLGVRGPPGFFRAVIAAQGDDARGGALVILTGMGATAAGTAIAAPFIEVGLVPLAFASLLLQATAVASLILLPPLPESP